MQKEYIQTGSLLCLLSVLLGALGAHAVKNAVPQRAFEVYETAARYQFYHSLGILIIGILPKEISRKWLKYAAWSFIIGIILFSGSLYLLTYIIANDLSNMNWIGIFTPIGGILFISGWFFIFLSARNRNEPIAD